MGNEAAKVDVTPELVPAEAIAATPIGWTDGEETPAIEVKTEPEHEAIAVEPETPGEGEEEDMEFGPNAPHYVKLPEPNPENKPPKWWPKTMLPPKGFKFPRGIDVYFVRIRGKLTAAKAKGDRFVICWENGEGDIKLAYSRCNGDMNRASSELAKQMIRFIDGAPVNWDGMPGAGSIDQFWREVGAKGRSQFERVYTQLHVLDRTEQTDFFENCVGRVATG